MTEATRTLYHVSISFLQPTEATVPVAAESPDQAIDILKKMFADRQNFQIHDIYNVKDCPELDVVEDLDEDADEETPTKH